MDPVAVFIVVLFALSLFVAVTGRRWGLAFPVGAALLGLMLFATGQPTGPEGGDADPQRVIGGVLIIFAVPWALVYLVVAAVARRLSRQ